MRRAPRPARLAVAAAALSWLGGCTTGAGGGSPAPAAVVPEPGDAVVKLVGLDFEPRQVEVPAGRRVVWEWTDQVVHNVVSEGQSFASSSNQGGGAYAVRFDKDGTYPYRCTLHAGMDGTVVAR